VALDANRYTDLMRGVTEAVEVIGKARAVYIPFVVLAELRCGARLSARPQRNESVLAEFLSRERVQVLWPDDGTTRVYADLFLEIRRAGRPIPSNDLWIAALCIQHGLILCTRDKHFDALPRLARI
jgi:predicted nucleic acid-binding protein